ncbi:Protein dpy-19 [Penaeus vannamei]|uniref:Protein dpy-19 n=1 Tax=Penaeus vannamei TaxID=6689 RepID=A0A3R7MUI0_PENVA|nr:Protein dpy-19 [Penaeus vannamei]
MAAKHRRNAEDERSSKNKRNNNPQKEIGATKPPKQEGEKRPSLLVVLICSICCGVVHSIHVSTMFENDRHFSHLSNLEREMTFRTEMGLYYSYYKTLVNADSFLVGLNRLMHDNLTEYPDTINTLQRFNLYPEVILGGTYRIFDAVTSWLGMEMRVCWQVSRGAGLSPVVSCEGLGDPAYWYLAGVWVSAGLTAALLFLQGVELSGSLLGGFLTVLCFFFNHGEATRVQWTPPLRESFAFPWSIALNIGVTQAVRAPRPVWTRPLLLGTLTLAYLLCWQFAQFTVVAVVGIVYAMYTIGIIHPIPMLLVLLGTSYGFLNNVVLQFGEYSNPELEELIEWIQSETQEDAVFAGPMAIMANVLLSTRRPIANHPHYEHAGLRERTKKVYSVYSRRSAEMVYETLLSMKVNYVVLEETWCLRKNRPGCGMVDLWDVEEPQNRHKPSLCPRLFHRSPAPFHRVFDNGMFVVLQVPSRYVEIPPPRYHNV